MARAEQAFPIREPGLMIRIYLHCTLESGIARVLTCCRCFRRHTNPVILERNQSNRALLSFVQDRRSLMVAST